MNNRPLTPREISEERRLWRRWLRWFVRHHPRFNLARICGLITEYLDWYSLQALAKYLELLTQILRNLLVASKFCNGLIGVSLTDSLPAPAIN
ncbi:MAG: hypothetical protein ACM65M_08055 [Microcoleus sp.]